MKNDEQYVNEIFQKYNKIQNTKEEKFYKKNMVISPVNAFFRTIVVILSWITLTGCVAYATSYVIDKVFKEPEMMSYQESISINDKEKKELISEDKAKEFAVKELNDRFNKQPGNITKTELRKDYISYEPRWIIFYDNNEQIITKDQAIEIATNKEKELDNNKFKVSSIDAKLEIVKMNEYVYSQENPINNTESEINFSESTKVAK